MWQHHGDVVSLYIRANKCSIWKENDGNRGKKSWTSLFIAPSFLLKIKQKLTNWPFDISQFGLFSPKSSFQGPLGECFSLARLLWICSSAVSPGQTPSRSLLIGRQWVTRMHRLFFKTFSTPVTWPFYISPQTHWKCRCWEWEKGGMETTRNRCFEMREYFPNVLLWMCFSHVKTVKTVWQVFLWLWSRLLCSWPD